MPAPDTDLSTQTSSGVHVPGQGRGTAPNITPFELKMAGKCKTIKLPILFVQLFLAQTPAVYFTIHN